MNRRVIALSALMLLPAAAASATPFQNGSFEIAPTLSPGAGFVTLGTGSTAITGWEVYVGTVDYIGTYWEAAQGIRSVDLNGASTGGIRQVFDTTAGADYRIRFALAGNPDGPPTTKDVLVQSGAFSQIFSFSIPAGTTHSDMNWAEYSFDFSAGASATTLSFLSTTGGGFYGPALDDVRVSAVPEPATLSLFGLGLAGAAIRRRFRK